jgi:hypothetical protein
VLVDGVEAGQIKIDDTEDFTLEVAFVPSNAK